MDFEKQTDYPIQKTTPSFNCQEKNPVIKWILLY